MNDPLNEITKRYVAKASTENQSTEKVIDCVVSDYIRLLYMQGVSIPQSVRQLFICDIKEEIREIIVRITHTSVEVPIQNKDHFELFRKIS